MFSVLFKGLKQSGSGADSMDISQRAYLDLIAEIDPKVLIYYCIDSFQASSKGAKNIIKTEKQLIQRSDLVFVTSQALFDHCACYSKKVHYFPFGVNVDNFIKGLDLPIGKPSDIKDIKNP
jgi:hypothetical protein